MWWFAILTALVGCRFHFDETDNSAFPYVEVAPGWSVDVFADFSSRFAYVDPDFVDGDETYDNMPLGLFTLRAPYPDVLAVLAGRKLIEVASAHYVEHDFGNHPPDTPGLPDHLSDGIWTPNAQSGAPLAILTSSSNLGGDGTFVLSPQWTTATDYTQNNTRAFGWDQAGAFDARGVPEGYLATAFFLIRRSDGATLLTGDYVSIVSIGAELFVVRRIAIDTDERIIKLGSQSGGTYPETELYQAGSIELGDGTPPAPAVAWAIADFDRLLAVNPAGTPTTLATSSDPDVRWQDCSTPPAGHPLATAPNIIYVLETNRALDRDRILRFTAP